MLPPESTDEHSEANHSLKGMITSMQEFDTASDKISRIIKVIDEIAFQTDLLALNAAVEAVRTDAVDLGSRGPDRIVQASSQMEQAAQETAASEQLKPAAAHRGKPKNPFSQLVPKDAVATPSQSPRNAGMPETRQHRG